MKVSVIINCHNGMEFLNQAVDSVLKQTFKEFEIIFFDNNSTDQSAYLIHQYKDGRIKYHKSEVFLSLGEARNSALKHAKGEVIAFLDVDDIWDPRKLESQLPLLNEEVGLVYTGANIIFNNKSIKKVSTNSPEGKVFGELLSHYFLVMSSVIISRQALDSLSHWFDPRFEIIEEYDLFLRISTQWELRGVRAQLTQWRWHEASTTMKKTKRISLEKRLLLRKFRIDYPIFYEKYLNEINQVKGKIIITSALCFYRENKSALARKLLSRSRVVTKKGFFVYLATFFSYKLVNGLYRRIKGNPLI